MVEISLHNSATRRRETLRTPTEGDPLRLYLCGPTVYDRAHLGNARPVVVFDVLVRLLRHLHGEDGVVYVRNFTDVDDKINARAAEMRAAGDGRSLVEIIRSLTDGTIGWYHADMDALGALRPDHEPRATDYIAEMIAMIDRLIARGHAYAAEGHVLFDVRSFPDYGRLSGRSVEDMIAGARVEIAPYKRDPMDFVLWKPSSDEEPGWDSPWGRGRPGWHIECSAMSRALLGPAFDIHGGGIDLMFPHHENEIAQSCCAHPDEGFARVWLHNEMLLVEGKKMSKSLGNFFTVRDLLDKGVPGEVIRFVFLMTHYGKPMDWTAEKAKQAGRALQDMHRIVLQLLPGVVPSPEEVDNVFVEALANDLNTAEAIKHLHGFASLAEDEENEQRFAAAQALSNALAFLALWNPILADQPTPLIDPEKLQQLRQKLAALRQTAMVTKDFAAVDALKAAVAAAGVEVRMTRNDVQLVPGPDFDPDKLEAVL